VFCIVKTWFGVQFAQAIIHHLDEWIFSLQRVVEKHITIVCYCEIERNSLSAKKYKNEVNKEMELWRNMCVPYAGMPMMKQKVYPTLVLHQVQHGVIFQAIGYAPYAVQPKMYFKKKKRQ
jgi:hypothetical protein